MVRKGHIRDLVMVSLGIQGTELAAHCIAIPQHKESIHASSKRFSDLADFNTAGAPPTPY